MRLPLRPSTLLAWSSTAVASPSLFFRDAPCCPLLCARQALTLQPAQQQKHDGVPAEGGNQPVSSSAAAVDAAASKLRVLSAGRRAAPAKAGASAASSKPSAGGKG